MNDDNSNNINDDQALPRQDMNSRDNQTALPRSVAVNPFYNDSDQGDASPRSDMPAHDNDERPTLPEREQDDFLFGNEPTVEPNEQSWSGMPDIANDGGNDMAERGEGENLHTPAIARQDAVDHGNNDLGKKREEPIIPPNHADFVTVEEAVSIFNERGLPRHMRTIQKYCSKKTGRALVCYQVPTENGIRYMIERTSIDRFIGDAAQQAPTGKIIDEPTSGRTENIVEQTSITTTELDIFENPFVKRLEQQVERLENRNELLQTQIQDVLVNANERLVELQKANAVAQSESLGTFLLEAERIRSSQNSDSSHNTPINKEGERDSHFNV